MSQATPQEPLFLEFFYLLRHVGIPVSTREWLTFIEALSVGLCAASMHRLYALARATLIKSERHYDRFDQVFVHYFDGAELPAGLAEAIESWLENPLPIPQLSPEQLEAMQRLGLDELRDMFEERMKEQTERHDGGSKWIGTGGTSPFGHSGVHPGGIRVGGKGGGRSAVQVASQRRFQAYRSDVVLDTRQIGMALRKLRKLGRDGRASEVDIDGTINATARNAGDLEIEMMPPRANRLKVLLLMDVGGSMDPFSQLVSRLFSAANAASHFREFHAMYFHNCIYGKIYKDANLRDGMSTHELCRWLGKDTRVFYIGDAHMAPYELTAAFGAIDYYEMNDRTGLWWLDVLKKHFTKQAWLNPIPERFWAHPTIRMISEVFPMYPLTLDGLESAIADLA